MPVVPHFDHDLRALMICIQRNCAARAFARCDASFARFDSVVHRVTNDVRHRLRQGVENPFVEIGVLSCEFQGHIFSAVLCNIANHAREAAKELFDRNHANLQHRLVQFVEHACLKGERVHQLGANRIARVFLVELGEGTIQHRLANDQFTD